MTVAENQNPQLTARQAQRLVHFLGRLRVVLSEQPMTQANARELDVVDLLLAEVRPIVWPKPDVPPGTHDRNGNTR